MCVMFGLYLFSRSTHLKMERYHMFKLGLAVLFYAVYCIRPMLVNGLEVNDFNGNTRNKTDAQKADDYYIYYQGVQGKPWDDFPVYSHIPKTSFSCKTLDSGYYADLDTQCQVFHICEEGRKISFLCPNGTIFQQSDLICEWWFKVNCSNSPEHYQESAEQLREENLRRKQSRKVVDKNNNFGAVMRTEEHSSVSAVVQNPVISVKGTPRFEALKKSNEERTSSRNYNNNKEAKQSLRVSVSTNNKSKQSTFTDHSSHNSLKTNYYTTQEASENSKHKTNTESKKITNERPLISNNGNANSNPVTFNTPTNHKMDNETLNRNIYYVTDDRKPASNHNLPLNPQDQYVQIVVQTTSKTLVPKRRAKQLRNNPIRNNNKRITLSAGFGGSNSNNFAVIQDSKPTLKSFPNTRPTVGFVQSTKSSPQNTTPVKSANYNNFNNFNSVANVKSASVNDFRKGEVDTAKDNFRRQKFHSDEYDETQVLSETASFVKSPYNSISQSSQKSTSNPYPNHRTTYSEMNDASVYKEKLFTNKLTAVTPQYLSTQPINNGKPFVGSKLFTSQESTTITPTTTPIINKSTIKQYSGNPYLPFGNAQELQNDIQTTISPFNLGETRKTLPTTFVSTTTVYPTPNEQFNLGSTIGQYNLGTIPVGTTPPIMITAPPIENLNKGLGTIIVEDKNVESVTKKIVNHATIYGRFAKTTGTTPVPRPQKFELNLEGKTPTVFYTKSKEMHSTKPTLFGYYITNGPSQPLSTYGPSSLTTPTGAYRPRPFQVSNNLITGTAREAKELLKAKPATYPVYQISTAGPFTLTTELPKAYTSAPTEPTPAANELPRANPLENVDNMINTLMEITNTESETPRPGLVVPPSAGPQTLHTLAVYFANALDGIATEKGANNETESELVNTIMEDRITSLLTHMTQNSYNDLFKPTTAATIQTTTPLSVKTEDSNDLEAQHSKAAVETPKIRQLARVFTKALSAYLDDPQTFRKVLEEVRPTEPSSVPSDNNELKDDTNSDDELLNFSDADSKSSYPPIYPTSPAARPTWGYILALNNSSDLNNSLDVKNSLAPEFENLQSSDSQSFVSQFNSLNDSQKIDTLSVSKDTDNKEVEGNLPNNHWTSSADATLLWRSTFGVNPATINAHFDTTEPLISFSSEEVDSDQLNTGESALPFTTNNKESTEELSEDDVELLPEVESIIPGEDFNNAEPISDEQLPYHSSREIKYELRTLPMVGLNSTEVHGLLLDFMNVTNENPEESRLKRILNKLNTTEEEFLTKMKEIEENPLTRRLILLLISECGNTTSHELHTKYAPINDLLRLANPESTQPLLNSEEVLNVVSSKRELVEPPTTNTVPTTQSTFAQSKHNLSNNNLNLLVDPTLKDDDHDTRALQLLNSLYTIASKFGKKKK